MPASVRGGMCKTTRNKRGLVRTLENIYIKAEL